MNTELPLSKIKLPARPVSKTSSDENWVRTTYTSAGPDHSVLLEAWKMTRKHIPYDTRVDAALYFKDGSSPGMNVKYGDHQKGSLWQVSPGYYDAKLELAESYLLLLGKAPVDTVETFEVSFYVTPEVQDRLKNDTQLQSRLNRRGAPLLVKD